VDTGDGSILCTVTATDVDTGILYTNCTFESPTGASDPVSCTAHVGVDDDWTCTAVIPQSAEIGTWPVVEIRASDVVFNEVKLDSTAIAALTPPGDTSFDIVAAGGAGGAGGTGGTGGAGVCDSKTPDLSASTDSWTNGSQQSAAIASLTFTTYMRVSDPSPPSLYQGIVAISDTPVTQFDDAAMLVRFDFDGFFDVRNAGVYDCDNCAVPWAVDTWYKITITANVTAETYTVQVGECDDTPTTVITDAAFRNQGTNGDMDYYAVWHDDPGTSDLEGVVWTPGACTPDTCTDYDPNSCGTPPDGCGGPDLDCDAGPGTCDARQSGDVCDPNYQCCTPSSTVCTDPDPDYECGDWSDGCGSTVDCGTCGGGETCLGGACVEDSGFPTADDTGPEVDYWCPRWASLKDAKSGYSTSTAGDVIEYEDITGTLGLQADDIVVRCTKAHNPTGQTAMRSNVHDSSGGWGNLFENVQAGSNTSGGSGTMNLESGDMTVLRSKIYPMSCDGAKFTGGLWKNNYIDGKTIPGYPGCSDTGAHSDLIQTSEVMSPVWIIGSTFIGHSGPAGVVSNACYFITTDYGGGDGHCWGEPTRSNPSRADYTTGYWLEGNFWTGGNYPVRLSHKTGVCPSNVPWGRVAYNVWGAGDWTAASGPINESQAINCIEFVDNKEDDETPVTISDPNLETTYGACTSVVAIPTWTLNTPSLSSASCTQGQAACNDIDINGAIVTGGDRQTTGEPRWRYSCDGSSSNSDAAPCTTQATRCNVYQVGDEGADLWYDYPDCDDSTTCSMTDVCDFQSEGTGTYTVKIYTEPGPGASIREGDHKEMTFTIN
jgi:hypothetical protein